MDCALDAEGGHAYLASLLAQPSTCVAGDIRSQLECWQSLRRSEEEDTTELLPSWVAQLLTLMTGQTPRSAGDGALDDGAWLSLPSVWGVDGKWLAPYALSLGFGLAGDLLSVEHRIWAEW